MSWGSEDSALTKRVVPSYTSKLISHHRLASPRVETENVFLVTTYEASSISNLPQLYYFATADLSMRLNTHERYSEGANDDKHMHFKAKRWSNASHRTQFRPRCSGIFTFLFIFFFSLKLQDCACVLGFPANGREGLLGIFFAYTPFSQPN